MKITALRKFRKEVGQAIKSARNTLGVSMQFLADELGVSYQMVQHWEKGSKAMDMSRYVELCQLLGISPGKTINKIVDNVNRGRK